jgi:MYXO-CTERM domain-containing protein
VYVEKDIQLGGFAGGDFPSGSVINQTFSQVFVPEPSSMTLALAGLIGLWLWRRRRS